MLIQKRFPADTTLKETTFLNDKKIDAELYALLQSYSESEDGVTFVNRWDLPKQTDICEILGIKSAKTYRAHLNYLIESGYVVDEESRYVLPRMEEIYLLLPLATIQFMKDVFKDQVIKTYIYLGQKWRNDSNREFTYNEIGSHVGIKLSGNARGYEQIRNILIALSNCGLISVSKEYFVDKGQSRHRLLNWTTEFSKVDV